MTTSPARILYVEDNADLRDAVADLLATPRREIQTCASAEQALDLCGAHVFDAVITDVSLPGMSGADLARRLAQSHPALRVVICSGYEFGEHVALLGPNVASLPKPFEPEALDELLAAPPPAQVAASRVFNSEGANGASASW